MTVQITGIRKDYGNHYNRHEAVSHYRWVDPSDNSTGIATRQGMVGYLEAGNTAYVVGNDGQKAYCYVNVSAAGTRFLQTQSDGKWSDNLLNLPEV